VSNKPSGGHAGSVPQGKPRLSSNADALSVFKDRDLLSARWHNLLSFTFDNT
jgi:hypothetical protein